MKVKGTNACLMSLVAIVASTTILTVQAEAQTDAGKLRREHSTGIFNPDDPRNPELERLVWNALADSGNALTSIQAVACSDTECEIVFTGRDISDLEDDLVGINWDGRGMPFFKMWSLGHRVVSPGAEVRVLNMSTACPSSKGCELPEGAVALNSPEGREALRGQMNALQHAHYRYQNGLVDQESFDAQVREVAVLLQGPFVVDWWATNKHGFSASFQEFVDGIVERNARE